MYWTKIKSHFCLKTADDQGGLYPVNQKEAEKQIRLQLVLCVCVKRISRVEFRSVEVTAF